MRGAIAAGSGPSAQAGALMFENGGNAVDAAVAAAFASFVAESSISTFGGGGFATVMGPGRNPLVYDFFVAYPGIGRETMPTVEDLDFTPVEIHFSDVPSIYHAGRGCAAVPGNPAGLAALLADAGSMPLSEVVVPATQLAREGVTLTKEQVIIMDSITNLLTYTPQMSALFAPEGPLLEPGAIFRNPPLANTLEHFGRHGVASAYTGELGDAIVQDCRENGGLIRHADLAAYQVNRRQPVTVTYRRRTVHLPPPPSVGGVMLAYMLRLLDRADLNDMTHGDANHIALLTEIMRQTTHVRENDPPRLMQTDEDRTRWLNDGRIDLDWAAVTSLLNGHGSTTHISAVDETGLAVSLTTTPGATGGYVVGDTGILTNNMLGEIVLNPDGFLKGVPGSRLISMMSPGVVDDPTSQTRLVVGSAGASRILSANLQVISNIFDWDLPAQASTSRARVHFEDDVLDLEYGYAEQSAAQLEAQGYPVRRWRETNLYFGGANIAYLRADGSLSGAGDPRRGGAIVIVD